MEPRGDSLDSPSPSEGSSWSKRVRSEREASLPATEKPVRSAKDTPNDAFNALGATRIVHNQGKDANALRRRGAESETASWNEDDLIGKRFGDFQIIKKLGKGAMATVYKAYQVSFERKVALKLLHKHIADNPKLIERFYREARSLGELDHPNIVQGFGVDELDGIHYFVMEYIRGDTLQSWLTRMHHFSVGDAMHVTLACAMALEHAHGLDMVHRDVKPDNVLITKDGWVKLADMGMVKRFDDDMSLTQTGHAVGTPWYMPLEQAKNAKETDGRCDIYALGCMFYYMLTGKPPFTGATLVEVIHAKEKGTFPPARSLNQDVSERLDLIIMKMTAKLPKHRYQSCTEMIADLEALELAAPELEFLHQEGPSPSLKQTPPPSQAPQRKSQFAGNVSFVGQAAPTDLWYVRLKAATGNVAVRELTTEQLEKLVGERKLNPQTKISRTEDGAFRALATYREFEHLVLSEVTKSHADRKAVKYRRLYKQLEEDDQRKQSTGGGDDERGPGIAFTDILKMLAPFAGGIAVIGFLAWLVMRLLRVFT